MPLTTGQYICLYDGLMYAVLAYVRNGRRMGFNGLWGEYWATLGIRLVRPGEPTPALVLPVPVAVAGAGAGEGGCAILLCPVVFRFLLAGVVFLVVCDNSLLVVALRVASLIIMAAAVAAVSCSVRGCLGPGKRGMLAIIERTEKLSTRCVAKRYSRRGIQIVWNMAQSQW